MNWIPAVMSIFGGIMGYQGGQDLESAGKRQEKQAEQNALLEKTELREQVRRQELQDRRLRASALARGAASGARVEGSVATELDFMAEEQTRQLDWTKSAGASRIRLQLQADMNRADATQTRGKTQQWSSLFTAGAMAFGYGDRAGLFGTK